MPRPADLRFFSDGRPSLRKAEGGNDWSLLADIDLRGLAGGVLADTDTVVAGGFTGVARLSAGGQTWTRTADGIRVQPTVTGIRRGGISWDLEAMLGRATDGRDVFWVQTQVVNATMTGTLAIPAVTMGRELITNAGGLTSAVRMSYIRSGTGLFWAATMENPAGADQVNLTQSAAGDSDPTGTDLVVGGQYAIGIGAQVAVRNPRSTYLAPFESLRASSAPRPEAGNRFPVDRVAIQFITGTSTANEVTFAGLRVQHTRLPA